MMKDFGDQLIDWYKIYKRDLPWRDTSDPYKIWLSEIILQQTRVAQGLDYYLRFIEKYPDIFVLQKASRDEIYKLWQGLGYYNRADNLMVAAKTIVAEHKGVFPDTPEELIKIKGIGPYTSAAIASIAFNYPIAVVDGNVYRVLARVFNIATPINSGNGKKEFELLAGKLLADHPPALFNQAIMEFGALHCKPKNPGCDTCIFQSKCLALRSKRISSLPVKENKIKIKTRYFHYLLVESQEKEQSKIYLRHRNDKDIWKNLYDLPCIEMTTRSSPEEIINSNYLKSFVKTQTFIVESVSHEYIHQLTHQKIHAHFYRVIVDKISELPNEKNILLVEQNQITNYPVPRLIERYLKEQEII